ncbi:MAG: formylglycine-generating enzyme family protein [Planctomycetota bacterium]
MKFRLVNEVKESRRKGDGITSVFDQLLTSKELLKEYQYDPFALLKEAGYQFNADDFLDMTTDSWRALGRGFQIHYAQAYQKWYAECQKLPSENDFLLADTVPLKMMLIPPGRYWQGDSESNSSDEQQRRVLISQAFWCGKYEVSQKQWIQIMGENPSFFNDGKTKNGLARPVEEISWNDCKQFCKKAGFRLLTEAEWEYVCRSGTLGPFFFGNDISTDQVNYNGKYPYYPNGKKGENRRKTIEVGTFPSNSWGIHDMHGNVEEWCEDGYAELDEEDVIDPQGKLYATERVIRGGSWVEPASYCLSGFRRYVASDSRSFHLGFRVAKSISN